MKNFFTIKKMKCFLASVFTLVILTAMMSRQSEAYIIGTSSFSDTVYTFNDPSWTIFSQVQATLSGFSVLGIVSISWNSADGDYYAIVRTLTGNNPRRLVKINPVTGVCTDIGNMGAAFSSLTFSPSGVCYAIGGAGSGAFSERLYTINLSNASPTFVGGPYSIGADGEVIAYNYSDDNIYHWSGNGTPMMERIDANTFAATAITQSGEVHFEIFGAVYIGGGLFYATDIQGRALSITSTGFATELAIDITTNGPVRGLAYNDPLLPVELASFTSSLTGRDVTLNWTTTTETNNARFEIERSSGNASWTKLGFVNGHGTSVIPCSYTFSDMGLNSGTYSYRLKQIDYNGHFEYFNLSNEVNIGVPGRYALSQNYPNPFNPSTNINFELPLDSRVSIKLFDMSGKEVATLVDDMKTAGYYNVNFNSSNLSSGVYFYKMTAQNFSDVKRMILLK